MLDKDIKAVEAQYDGITELKTKIEMMGMSEEFSGCKDLDRVLYMCYMRCHVKVPQRLLLCYVLKTCS